MKLKEFAANNNLSYSKAWRMFNSGELQGYKDDNGVIHLGSKTVTATTEPAKQSPKLEIDPVFTAFEETASYRSNKSATQNPEHRYKHIDNSVLPFSSNSNGYSDTSDISIRDVIILTQKCYYSFALCRTTIDLMTEFCVGNIHFRGGSKKSRDFFKAYCNFTGINWEFQDQFYREFFRSGNDFIYKVLGKLNLNSVQKMNQAFGIEATSANDVPLRYIILNPADIIAAGSISFANAIYYKNLTDYELERLKNPRTKEDQEVFDSLSEQDKKNIRGKSSKSIGSVKIQLDNKNIVAVFYKKQPYEAFAVPMVYPVLEDINFKKELRLMDQAIARTAQQAILLITQGTDPEKGGVNPKAMEILKKAFENESVARVIISDYTVKAQFVIPQIADILDPKKYEVIDRDIALGLNNVLMGQGEKFANQHAKIEIFIERLKHARQAFLNNFLIPEIKNIAEALGLKNYPEPFYEDLDLKDELEYSKLYIRLCELGVLTPDETFTAINTGTLPAVEDSVSNQEEFKKHKDKGLYKPLMAKEAEGEGAGRPGGTKAPKSKVSVGPIGGEYLHSKIIANSMLAAKLSDEITAKIQSKYKLKEINSTHQEIIGSLTDLIITNENTDNWLSKVDNYIENPVGENKAQTRAIDEIAASHGVTTFLAGILYHSKPNE